MPPELLAEAARNEAVIKERESENTSTAETNSQNDNYKEKVLDEKGNSIF